jgi:hypothetical protein
MPCYFFHIENGERISSDAEAEFSDDEAAIREAEGIAQDLSRNQISRTRLKVIVTNRAGDQVGEVPLPRKASS